MLTLQLGSCAGFGGDSSITHTRKSRAVSPPIDTDILGSDDEDSGVLQNKLKEVFGACARSPSLCLSPPTLPFLSPLVLLSLRPLSSSDSNHHPTASTSTDLLEPRRLLRRLLSQKSSALALLPVRPPLFNRLTFFSLFRFTSPLLSLSLSPPSPPPPALSPFPHPLSSCRSLFSLADDVLPPGRFVFILSDRTGFTASHILTAVLYQFGLAGDNVVTQ
eukprot:1944318-Rhodomonas_salina.1